MIRDRAVCFTPRVCNSRLAPKNFHRHESHRQHRDNATGMIISFLVSPAVGLDPARLTLSFRVAKRWTAFQSHSHSQVTSSPIARMRRLLTFCKYFFTYPLNLFDLQRLRTLSSHMPSLAASHALMPFAQLPLKIAHVFVTDIHGVRKFTRSFTPRENLRYFATRCWPEFLGHRARAIFLRSTERKRTRRFPRRKPAALSFIREVIYPQRITTVFRTASYAVLGSATTERTSR